MFYKLLVEAPSSVYLTFHKDPDVPPPLAGKDDLDRTVEALSTESLVSTVLLIDGHEDSRTMYAIILRHCGHTVLEARGGSEALLLAAAHPPDLIICDVLLPQLSGLETLELLQQQLGGIPAIAIASSLIHRPEVRALNAGCVALLTRPVYPLVLAEYANLVLRRKRLLQGKP